MAAGDSGAISEIMRNLLSGPDIAIKVLAGLLATGAGAASLAHARNAFILVRLVAIPLSLIWPHGTLIAAWTSWCTLRSDWSDDSPPQRAT